MAEVQQVLYCNLTIKFWQCCFVVPCCSIVVAFHEANHREEDMPVAVGMTLIVHIWCSCKIRQKAGHSNYIAAQYKINQMSYKKINQVSSVGTAHGHGIGGHGRMLNKERDVNIFHYDRLVIFESWIFHARN